MLSALHELEQQTGKEFGNPYNPLLVSCRSGAKFSMPGMMDTVLNIGLNDEVVAGLIELTGDARFAYDAYRRLIQMFGTVVLSIADEPFEAVLADYRNRRQAAAFEFVLERLQSRGMIEWIREPEAIHVAVMPRARTLLHPPKAVHAAKPKPQPKQKPPAKKRQLAHAVPRVEPAQQSIFSAVARVFSNLSF